MVAAKWCLEGLTCLIGLLFRVKGVTEDRFCKHGVLCRAFGPFGDERQQKRKSVNAFVRLAAVGLSLFAHWRRWRLSDPNDEILDVLPTCIRKRWIGPLLRGRG